MKWISTSEKGVRYREHPTRKHGVRKDRYFAIRYRRGDERREEGLGWASEGWTLPKAADTLRELKTAHKRGEGATTLAEKREQAKTAKDEAKRREQAEATARITLGEYFQTSYRPWAESVKAAAFSKELSHWRLWIEPALGSVPMREIQVPQWDGLTKTLGKAGLSERSREYVCGTLRRILKHAYERHVVETPPPTGRMIGVTAPKNNRRERLLSPAELETLLAEIKKRDPAAWRLTLFAALTGCRASEACNLRWKDVRLEARTARFEDTKNGTSRTIPLAPALCAMLAETSPGAPGEPVFLNQLGRPYQEAPAAFRKAVEDLGLNAGRPPRERFCFHGLRHMAATGLARELSLRGLMDFLGWKVPAMPLRYVHTDEQEQRRAAEALERRLSKTAAKVVSLSRRASGDDTD